MDVKGLSMFRSAHCVLPNAYRLVGVFLVMLFVTAQTEPLLDFEKAVNQERIEKKRSSKSSDKEPEENNQSSIAAMKVLWPATFFKLYFTWPMVAGLTSHEFLKDDQIMPYFFCPPPKEMGSLLIPFFRLDVDYLKLWDGIEANEYKAELDCSPIGLLITSQILSKMVQASACR